MNIKKAKLSRFDDDGWTEIIRSELPTIIISMMINSKIENLSTFIIATQKGERQIHIQRKKCIERYSNKKETEMPKFEYYLYLNAVQFAILELNRMIEVYHHQFIAHVDENIEINLMNSPKFDFCKKKLKENGILISKVEGYNCINEIRKISNDLKHSFVQEYSLTKTLNLKKIKDFKRTILVDKINLYFEQVPKYIISLASEINKRYPRIEKIDIL